ncbi:hypothetical protein [Roseisolibacter agri]|uniref:Uncharacterized protein n=1 Tax=Roseisolibacter agri TaxID=2014610 RepID=A0AA37QJ01_9BACT|nr:hypothetical protein [Roseisolibacter agri]GLC26693.1 hypothetical protein rosag_32060 [Roseisolibacter agri]
MSPGHSAAARDAARSTTAPATPSTPAAARPRMAGSWHRALAGLVLGGAVGRVAWALWQARDYVPVWDARIYADCIVRAAVAPLAPGALRCAEHPTHAYVAVLAAFQRLAPGSMPLLLLANGLLLLLGALAFMRLLRRVFPDPALAPERALLTAALLIDPVVVAGAVHVNPDFGILVFLLVATAAATERRWGIAAVFGLMAAFSKETGPVLYAALVASFATALVVGLPVARDTRNGLLAGPVAFLLIAALLPWGPWSVPVALLGAGVLLRAAMGARWAPLATAARLRRAMPLGTAVLPLVVFTAYMAWRATLPRTSLLWAASDPGEMLQALVTPHLRPPTVTYFGFLLLVNFHWIPGAAILADLLVGIRGFATGRPSRTVPGADPRMLLACTLFGAAAIFLITRIPTAPIARYMQPVFPVLLLLALAALLRLRVPTAARRATLAALVVLLGASLTRTLDPVSRAVWGTHSVGSREMLWTNRLVHRFHYGLDEGLYNLEFLRIAQLSQRALDRLHPVRDRVLVTGSFANWWIVGALDERSQRRFGASPLSAPTLAHAEDVIAGGVRPDSAWYLAYPYIDNLPLLQRLDSTYVIGPPVRVEVDGYVMSLRRLTRRDAR